MIQQQGSKQKQENSLPPITKIIKKSAYSKGIKEKMAYFNIKTPSLSFSQTFEDVNELLNMIVKNSNIQAEQLNQILQEVELKIKYLNQERRNVSQKLSELSFGHLIHMIDVYLSSDDAIHKYISFYLMKIWIKNIKYSEQYVEAMLGSIDESFPFQKEVFSFLQELSIEKPDVLDKILKIAYTMISNLQSSEQGNQEINSNSSQQVKNSNGGFIGKNQEEFLEFTLNILQKFESQQLEKDLVPIIQKYTPQNLELYHQIVLENFLNNEVNYEKYFNVCIEFIKKGLESDDEKVVLDYIKMTESFYLKIKNTSRRGEFVKLLISNILILRQTKKQDLIKVVRTLWKPTIFSDKEGQEKIQEHLDDIIAFLCSKFTTGDEEKILMAADSMIEILDKVIKESTDLEKYPIEKKLSLLNQVQIGCFMNKLSNQEKALLLYSKFLNKFSIKQLGLQIQALCRVDLKSLKNLDFNILNEFFEKQQIQIDLKTEFAKFNKFTASTFLLFLLNNEQISEDIEQKFKQIAITPIGLYKMNHNTIHAFLSLYSHLSQSKSILESNILHYFKLERLPQLKELEKYYTQDYIKNLISSYKGIDSASVSLPLYLQQTAGISSNQSNNQQLKEKQSSNKSIYEYTYIPFEQKRIMFADLDTPLPQLSQQPIQMEESNLMEVEEPVKQVQNIKQISQKQVQQGSNQNKSEQAHNKKQQPVQDPNYQKPQQKLPNPQSNQPQNQNQNQQKNVNTRPSQKIKTPTKQVKEDTKVKQGQEVETMNEVNKTLENSKEQPTQIEEKMQTENVEIPKQNDTAEEQKEIPQKNTLVQSDLQEQKQNEVQKSPPKIVSSNTLEQEKPQQEVQQQEKQQTEEQQNIQVQQKIITQEPEKMEIEQEKKEINQLQTESKPSSSQNLKDPKPTLTNAKNLQLPSLEIKKQGSQTNTPSLNIGQNQQGNKPTLGAQKTQQAPPIQQSNLQSNEKTEKQNSTENLETKSQTPTSAKPLTMKEQALLRMKNKQQEVKQGNIPQVPQIQLKEQPQVIQTTTSTESTPVSTKVLPTLGIKQVQQQVKSSETLDKPQQENKPSLESLKKPSLLMAKKKPEGQTTTTPSNQIQSSEKMDIETPQSQQLPSSQQNLEKNQVKPGLSLKPKMVIKSTENLQNTDQKSTSDIKSTQELKKIEEVEEGQVGEGSTKLDQTQTQIAIDKKDEKDIQIEKTNIILENKQEEEQQINDNKSEQLLEEKQKNNQDEVKNNEEDKKQEQNEEMSQITEKNEDPQEMKEVKEQIEIEEEELQEKDNKKEEEDNSQIEQKSIQQDQNVQEDTQNQGSTIEKQTEDEEQNPQDVDDTNVQNTDQNDLQINEENRNTEETAEVQNQIEEEVIEAEQPQDEEQQQTVVEEEQEGKEEGDQQINEEGDLQINEEGDLQMNEEGEALEADLDGQEGQEDQQENQQEGEQLELEEDSQMQNDLQEEGDQKDELINEEIIEEQIKQGEEQEGDQKDEQINQEIIEEQVKQGEEEGEANEGEQN